MTSTVAATGGADVPPDRYRLDWTLGAVEDAAGVNLLPPADGLALWADRYGLDVVTEDATP